MSALPLVAPGRRPTVGARGRRGRKVDTPLAALLATEALARLVSFYAVRPDDAPHLRALLRLTGLGVRSLQAELARLERLGALRRETDGTRVRFRLVPEHPAWPALLRLVRACADPAALVRLALAGVPGVAAAFVFGSTAAGTARPDSDVDVFVLTDGTADPGGPAARVAGAAVCTAIYPALAEVGVALGREVNAVVRDPATLAARLASEPGFYHRVLAGPKGWAVGGPGTLEAALADATPGVAGPAEAMHTPEVPIIGAAA